MSEVRFYNINTDKLEPITQDVVDTLFTSCMVNLEIISAIEALTSIRRQFAVGNITKDALFAALGPVHRAANGCRGTLPRKTKAVYGARTMSEVSDWAHIDSPIPLPTWAELRADYGVWAIWVPSEDVHFSSTQALGKERLQTGLRILSDAIFDKKHPGQMIQMRLRKMQGIQRCFLSRGTEAEGRMAF